MGGRDLAEVIHRRPPYRSAWPPPDRTFRVIDWGYPGCGAPWVDPAFMILRLVEAGHTAIAAEAWAHAHLDHAPNDEQLTAFAVYIAGLWGYWAATGDLSGSEHRARLAREYAAWRAW